MFLLKFLFSSVLKSWSSCAGGGKVLLPGECSSSHSGNGETMLLCSFVSLGMALLLSSLRLRWYPGAGAGRRWRVQP